MRDKYNVDENDFEDFEDFEDFYNIQYDDDAIELDFEKINWINIHSDDNDEMDEIE